jgi:hypothetical protein
MKKSSTMKRDPEVEAFLNYLDSMPDAAIDWKNAPKTTAADWETAEILLPVDRDIFEEAAKKQLRRVRASGALAGRVLHKSGKTAAGSAMHDGLAPRGGRDERQTLPPTPKSGRRHAPADPAHRKRIK